MATEGPKKYTARVVMPLVTIGMEGNLIKLANVENTGFYFSREIFISNLTVVTRVYAIERANFVTLFSCID